MSVINFSEPMAERAKNRRLRAAAFFDIDKAASAETVRILANHWKRRYHPDKGGDPEIFERICKAERTLLAKRGAV